MRVVGILISVFLIASEIRKKEACDSRWINRRPVKNSDESYEDNYIPTGGTGGRFIPSDAVVSEQIVDSYNELRARKRRLKPSRELVRFAADQVMQCPDLSSETDFQPRTKNEGRFRIIGEHRSAGNSLREMANDLDKFLKNEKIRQKILASEYTHIGCARAKCEGKEKFVARLYCEFSSVFSEDAEAN